MFLVILKIGWWYYIFNLTDKSYDNLFKQSCEPFSALVQFSIIIFRMLLLDLIQVLTSCCKFAKNDDYYYSLIITALHALQEI